MFDHLMRRFLLRPCNVDRELFRAVLFAQKSLGFRQNLREMRLVTRNAATNSKKFRAIYIVAAAASRTIASANAFAYM